MRNPKHKKTFWRSIVILFFGSSCCWMSALAVWLGGAAFVGTTASYLESAQLFLIGAGVVWGVVTVVRFWKIKR